jgi:hypothetical protein
MRFLIYLMRGLHNVVGITAPKPEHEAKVVFVWIGIAVTMVIGVAALGYFFISMIASTR